MKRARVRLFVAVSLLFLTMVASGCAPVSDNLRATLGDSASSSEESSSSSASSSSLAVSVEECSESVSSAAVQEGSSVSLSLDDPTDYYLVNVCLSNFSEVFFRLDNFAPGSGDADMLAFFAIGHCAYNTPKDWEFANELEGTAFFQNVPSECNNVSDGFNVRVSSSRIEWICERYLGQSLDFSQLNATTSAGYKYWDGYVYFRVTNGYGAPEGIALSDSLTSLGGNRYKVSFTVYRPVGMTYDATDQSWYSLSREEIASKLATGKYPFTSTTGTAVLQVSEEEGGKRVLVETISIFG